MGKAIKRQLRRLERREQRALRGKLQINPITSHIQIPEKLHHVLYQAFFKAFQLVFEKGTELIEKTYHRRDQERAFEYYHSALCENENAKHVRAICAQAKKGRLRGTGFALAEGALLGIFGVGLPDIPLFTASLLRSIYKVAISYGFDYHEEKERCFLLLLIIGALCKNPDKCHAYSSRVDILGECLDSEGEIQEDLQTLMELASTALADSLLTAKFIQGFPIIGLAGGVINAPVYHRLLAYADRKYQKRYLRKVDAAQKHNDKLE